MDEEKILCQVFLGDDVNWPKKTKHYVGGMEMQKPAELRIVTFASDKGYYLYYCDKSGAEMTDTYHDTLDEAKEQAHFEFGVRATDWKEG